MDPEHLHTNQKKVGLISIILFRLAAVDVETMRLCPQRDWDYIRKTGALMVATWIYLTGLFFALSFHCFQISWPALLAMAVFLASFIIMIEMQLVMYPSWYLNGLVELLRGGLEIPEASAARMKAWIALGLRGLMAFAFAQLSALIFGLVLFSPDIDARLDLNYHQRNGPLIAAVTAMVDGRIASGAATLEAQRKITDDLAGQVTAIRQNQVDPIANDIESKQLQTELSRLVEEKAKADDNVVAAADFAADELGGIKGGKHSGQPGVGPRRRAAVERAAGAKQHAREVEASLNGARARMTILHQRLAGDAASTKQKAETQLPSFEKRLADEKARQATLRDEQAKLIDDREAAIRKALLSSPDYSALETGLLEQMAALDAIAHDNPRVAALIIIVDLASFSLEMAAVACKSLVYVPTTYAGLIARDAYAGSVKLVEEMMADLRPDRAESRPSSSTMGSKPANDNSRGDETESRSIFDTTDDPPPQPPRRGRGRPRKNTFN